MKRLLVLALFSAAGWAQSTGELTGFISDPSGAPVASAKVSLRDLLRNTMSSTQTNETGLYRIAGLPPGMYALTASSPGFADVRLGGIVIEVNRISRADATLSLAGTSTAVEVVAQAQLLDVESGTKGTVLSLDKARDLPLQTRNPLALATLTPGALAPIPSTGADPTNRQGSDGTAASSNIILNGGIRSRGGFTEVVVDGISVTSQRDGVIQALPAADALQEFRVQSGGMGAEVGRTVGGVINYATRSGTNELRGSAFWTNRNTATTARRALPAAGRKPQNNYNQYGVTIGGPILLPKIYDGRNKTFFLFSFDGSRWLRNNPTLDTVPTAAMRTGDFSAVAAGIFDPISAPLPGQRTVFPNNVIPSSRFSALGKAMVDAFPLPTRPGLAANYDGVFRVVTPVDNYTARLDQSLGTRHRIMGRVTWIESINNQRWNLGDIDGRTGVSDIPSRNVTINYSFTIAPSLLYTTSAGYTWFHRTFIDPTGNQAGAGFFNMQVQPAPISRVTNIRPIITWDLYRGLGGNTVEDQISKTYQWNQSLAWIKGAHTLRFGTDLRWFVAAGALTVGAPNGAFGFSAQQTSQGNAITGYAAASALLGLPNSVSFAQPPRLRTTKTAPSFYLQDDFRVSPTLTLNLGLRFDQEGGLVEAGNRIGYFSDATNPLLKRPGVFRYAGRDGEDRSIVRNYLALSPRVGFAWAPKVIRAFVFRGAFGAYNAPVPTVGPYSAAIGFEPTLQFVKLTATDAATPLARSWIIPAAGGPVGPSAYFGQSVSQVLDRRLDPPRVYQWNIGFQKEILQNLVIEALYTGNRGTRVLADLNIDLPDRSMIDSAIQRGGSAAQSWLNELVPNPVAGLVPGTLGADRVTRSNAASRYPQFSSVSPMMNVRDSSYHALQATAQKRLGKNVSFLVSYTFSKLLTNFTNLQNPYDLRDSRGLSEVDRPHLLSASFVYSLPATRQSGWLRSVTGGFQLTGILRASSGAPFSVFQNAANGLGVGRGRPDTVGDPAAASRQVRRSVNSNGNVIWVSPASYTAVTGKFGNAPAADSRLRAPGFGQLDLGFSREFKIQERLRLRLNAQAFNAFNHTNLVGLDGNVNSPTFGQLSAVADPRIFQFGMEVRF